MIKKSLQTIFALCLTGFSLKAQCPVPDAGPDQSVCTGTDVTMAANMPASITGTWTKLGGFFAQGTITTAADQNTTITGLNTSGTVQFVWTLSDGASCNLKDTMTISVQAPPTALGALASKTICAGGTATMSALTPGNGSVGMWTILNGTNAANIVITDVNNRQTPVAGFFNTGTDTLRWTVSNALCGGSVFANVVIKTIATPDVAHAGSDQFVCQGDTVQLIGNVPGVGSPSWALPAGSGAAFYPTNGANHDTVKVRGGTAAGKVNIVYKITSGSTATATTLNGCLSTDTVVVSFGTSKPNAGVDIKLCKTGAGTVTLAATAPAAGETGNWTFVKKSGSELITDATSYTTTVTNITSDTLTLRWTLTSGVCSAYDDMNVIVLGAAPTHAVAGSNVTGCVGDTITLHGSIANSGTPLWRRSTYNPFFDINSFNIPFIPTNGGNDTLKVSLGAAGTYKLYYTITVGTATVGTCVSEDSLQIFVNPIPKSTAGANQTSCAGASTFTVNGTGAWVGTGKWTITGSRPGSLVQKDSSAIVSGLTIGNTVLAYTVSNGVCSKVSITTISIGIPSVANAGSDMTACVGDTVHLVGSVATSGSPTWSSGTGGFGGGGPTIVGNANNDSASVTSSKGFLGFGATTAGTYNVVYSISIGSNATGACVSRDTMKLTIKTCTITPTGIEEYNTTDFSVTVLPNPTSGAFNLTLKDSKISNAELTVLTLDGRTVITEQLGSVKDVQRAVNISNLSNGIYFIRVKKGDGIYTNKLVVQ